MLKFYELTITEKGLNKTASYTSEERGVNFKGVVSLDIQDVFYILKMVSPDGFKVETTTFIYDVHPIE